MKRFLRFFVSVAATAMLISSCGGTGIIGAPDNIPHNSQDKAADDIAIKIAMVSSPSGVDDGNFNEDIYNGIQAFIKNHPHSEVTPIREVSGESEAAVETISDVVNDYDVIVCGGYNFLGIGSIAEANPDKKFILVDGYPVDENDNEKVYNNIYAMEFKDEESGFLAGIAAALESKSKRVAVVTGIPYPSNVNYQFGFESGVNYANEKYYTGVEIVELHTYAGIDVRNVNVGGNYIGSFSDENKGKEITKELIAKGCDIIFVAAGAAGKGVFQAIKENDNTKNLMAIGCDVDQYDDGKNGSDNIILTSTLKLMHSNVEKQLENIALGKFKGENAILGAETDSTGYVKEKGRNNLTPYTISKLDETYKHMKSGEIVPASNFNEMTPENFVGLKTGIKNKNG